MIYPPAIATIVTRFSRLKQLKDQADHIAALDRRLKTCLSGPLAAHVRLATVRDGCLVMQADSPAWASELRFRTPEILAAVGEQSGFEAIRSLRIRTRTDPEPAERVPEKARLSEDAAATLRAHASSIEDPDVRAALLKIARHGKR